MTPETHTIKLHDRDLFFFSLFQKKPRPTRSLASRLSGYSALKKGRSETLDLCEFPNPVTSQSETSKSDLSQGGLSSEPVKDDVKNLPTPDGAEIHRSETVTSESSVILILEPLLLESPMENQSEISEFHNFGETSQSDINTSINIADIS